MARLLLVRHGLTGPPDERKFLGSTDSPLNDAGKSQVERLRDRLAGEKIDAVYASSLRRTRQTAGIITGNRGCEIMTFDELRECDFGEVEGLTFEEIEATYPELARVLRNDETQACFPGGESFAELDRRVSRFLAGMDGHTEDTVLIVGHSSPLRIMACHLLGIDVKHWRQFRLDPASLSTVYIYPHGGILTLWNDLSHLD